MVRKILGITGSRADFGLMIPVFQKITQSPDLDLDLVVTGMHLLPEFQDSLGEIVKSNLCRMHHISMVLGEDSGKAMAQSLGLAIFGIAEVIESVKPDIILLQGDRAEMLAGAIAAAHTNTPICHMSGGDYSGSIDDVTRNAISKFAHIHLTTCESSGQRLLAMGEKAGRIFKVGEPGLDVIKQMQYIPPAELAKEFRLDLTRPLLLATQHPVTTETDQAAWQMTQILEALTELDIQTVFTYPNTDAGGREMARVLRKYQNQDFLRIIPHLGSVKYLSMMRIASVLVGNSSSGIIEAPFFRLPVVNIGTRQYGRLRACNVIDTGYHKAEIVKAIFRALQDPFFRETLQHDCVNPYGDGTAAPKTIVLLSHLKLGPELINKWMDKNEERLVEEK
ncbi:MAG TPA: UDP-N-acetylglucosamine 2-epimerase (hydrolyzing) [Firmicutes bacterium]|jgi:GDP/UDP-N,N'-diacetylbacillosamine 2-epimerase (hydrolysing)|nr:UDP-N-acetylglucosamine 2-epimerase (hydrolyzing) [Bacillota bacterium]